MTVEEKILLCEIRSRNIKVFKKLFYDFYPCLVRYAEGFIYNPKDCEDVVQGVFIYFWEHSDKLNIDHSLRAYLYTSVKNRCLNYLRDRHIRIKNDFIYHEKNLNHAEQAECNENETINKIHSAIEHLPPRMAMLFRLKYIDGKKFAEIAELMEISENTVKTQIYRAKNKIRNCFV